MAPAHTTCFRLVQHRASKAGVAPSGCGASDDVAARAARIELVCAVRGHPGLRLFTAIVPDDAGRSAASGRSDMAMADHHPGRNDR